MTKYRILLWILIVVMLSVIFAFSSQSGEDSVALSTAVAEEQQHITSQLAEGGITEIDDFIYAHIRSMAHCILYFLLSVLIFIQCRLYGIKPLYAFVLAVFCCFLYGLSDEFHQKFAEGRTSCMADVRADTLGACVGGVLSLIFEKLFILFKGVRK